MSIYDPFKGNLSRPVLTEAIYLIGHRLAHPVSFQANLSVQNHALQPRDRQRARGLALEFIGALEQLMGPVDELSDEARRDVSGRLFDILKARITHGGRIAELAQKALDELEPA